MSTRKRTLPTATPETGIGRREATRYEHPAFGQVSVTRVQGRSRVMFGSELDHNSTVRIVVYSASLIRHLSNDWVHANRLPLIEFEFTEAQWAQFVSSSGLAAGTQCTLTGYRQGEFYDPPQIERAESFSSKFENEMAKAVDGRLDGIRNAIKRLADELAKPNVSKVALREILKELDMGANYLPGTAKFINEQFHESMEKIVEAGKSEIEAFIMQAAIRTGMEALRSGVVSLSQLEAPPAPPAPIGPALGDERPAFEIGDKTGWLPVFVDASGNEVLGMNTGHNDQIWRYVGA